MIKFVDNQNDIIRLWNEAFGDSSEEIFFFIDNIEHGQCIGYYEGSALLSMLYVVDSTVNGKAYKYIYAACTAKSARRRGCMKILLDYCISNYDRVLLIPADENLVLYYSKRGFTHKIDVDNILFNESDDIVEYLFEGCELEEPFALSNKGE